MKLSLNNACTPSSYRTLRVLLGAYVFAQFALMIPWGIEVYSGAGMIPDAASSPLIGAFPNFLALWDSPPVILGALFAGAILAARLAFGVQDRLAAVILWYLWACLFGRNPLTTNPSMPYIGWLLLAYAALPRLRSTATSTADAPADPNAGWIAPSASQRALKIHREIFAVAWILMALGYTYSGLTKLAAPSWVDGMAIRYVLENPLARPGLLRELFLMLPDSAFRGLTWSILLFEILYAPLALLRPARPWLWAGMFALHLGLIVLIDFASLTMGMLILHAFTFDPAWMRVFPRWKERLSFKAETAFRTGHPNPLNIPGGQ